MIPIIIHQTWKTCEIPPEWRLPVASWKRHHPNWEYHLWTNEDGYDFVQKYYPELYPVYCTYPYDIQRADVIRYLVVYHYGGLYADMDYECLQPFDELLAGKHFVIGYEPLEHFSAQENEAVLCNALFAAEPGAPFLERVIDHIQHQEQSTISMQDVLTTTGPLMMQRVLERHGKPGLDIYPSKVFCPLSYGSSALQQLVSNGPKSEKVRQFLIEQGVHAVHYWSNSWVKNISSTPLYNPEPGSIPGFTFYPGLDSHGNDLFNGGRDIPTLAGHCLQDEGVVAFNTDGFAKFKIGPHSDWAEMDNPDRKRGLYVKTGICTPSGPCGPNKLIA